MKHLDELTLNEYLDNALDKSERHAARLHLQNCAECQAKLDQLHSVFAELEALPETPLKIDLTPSILARLPKYTPVRNWTRAFAAQLGAALGLILWLAMQARSFIQIPLVTLPKLPEINLQNLLAYLLTLQLPTLDFQTISFNYQIPTFDFQIPTFSLEISTEHMVVLAVSVVLLWVAGNFLLLRSRQGVQ